MYIYNHIYIYIYYTYPILKTVPLALAARYPDACGAKPSGGKLPGR